MAYAVGHRQRRTCLALCRLNRAAWCNRRARRRAVRLAVRLAIRRTIRRALRQAIRQAIRRTLRRALTQAIRRAIQRAIRRAQRDEPERLLRFPLPEPHTSANAPQANWRGV